MSLLKGVGAPRQLALRGEFVNAAAWKTRCLSPDQRSPEVTVWTSTKPDVAQIK
jgi:hypothetical protein